MRNSDFHDTDRDYHGGGGSYDQSAPRPDLWQRLSRVMEVFLYLLILAAIMRLFWPEVEKQRTLNAELALVEQEQADHEKKLADLREEHGLLKSDAAYIELVARERLNTAKEGEYIIRIERPDEAESGGQEAEAAELPKLKPLKR